MRSKFLVPPESSEAMCATFEQFRQTLPQYPSDFTNWLLKNLGIACKVCFNQTVCEVYERSDGKIEFTVRDGELILTSTLYFERISTGKMPKMAELLDMFPSVAVVARSEPTAKGIVGFQIEFNLRQWPGFSTFALGHYLDAVQYTQEGYVISYLVKKEGAAKIVAFLDPSITFEAFMTMAELGGFTQDDAALGEWVMRWVRPKADNFPNVTMPTEILV